MRPPLSTSNFRVCSGIIALLANVSIRRPHCGLTGQAPNTWISTTEEKPKATQDKRRFRCGACPQPSALPLKVYGHYVLVRRGHSPLLTFYIVLAARSPLLGSTVPVSRNPASTGFTRATKETTSSPRLFPPSSNRYLPCVTFFPKFRNYWRCLRRIPR